MNTRVEAGRSPVHERLRRLLLLVPYVARHQGISVEELSGALGLAKETLLQDLDLLAMIGRPPFQPDDYIDIYTDNDRVYVDLDQRLSAPPRLTAAEAAALTTAAELQQGTRSEALASAISKLERVIPPGARDRWREMVQRLDVSLSPDRHFRPEPARSSEKGAEVRVRFSPRAAPYIKERFGGEASELPGGWAEVRVSGESERWLVQWVLSFGGDAEVIEPPWARQAVAAAARASLEC